MPRPRRTIDGIDLDRVPRHVAIVMDGNGRWARQRGLPRTAGHRAGEEAVARALDAALELGVSHLTLYAFSTENWRRSPAEVRFLLNDTERFVLRRRDEFHAKGVRMRWIGRRERRIPARVRRNIDESVEMTAGNRRLTLTVAFNYGGRAEIVDAVRRLAAAAREGALDPRRIDERAIARALYDPDLPDVDLFVRTSGEQRISNYLLWQSAYAELAFLPVLWPDFSREHLFDAVREYQRRERRFGRA
ncbi:MAG: di-trans,poly-cis-decaprenylcistransferase [Acidobacteria bacterium]|nr:di-trans,poly-cis-decaprenylcistransferase [Acidobacteriota bacterium]